MFIPVYSSLVLAPSWVIDRLPPPDQGADRPKPARRDAVRPLAWLPVYLVYLAAFMLVAHLASA